MSPDFLDLLRALLGADVRFLVVGAYAVGVHGRPRATKDLDVWVEASVESAPKVIRSWHRGGDTGPRLAQAARYSRCRTMARNRVWQAGPWNRAGRAILIHQACPWNLEI